VATSPGLAATWLAAMHSRWSPHATRDVRRIEAAISASQRSRNLDGGIHRLQLADSGQSSTTAFDGGFNRSMQQLDEIVQPVFRSLVFSAGVRNHAEEASMYDNAIFETAL
jgi:hypothetical protein